jgi:hypothetical protein
VCLVFAVVVGACGGGGGSANDAGPRGGTSGAAAGDAGSGGSGRGGAGAAGVGAAGAIGSGGAGTGGTAGSTVGGRGGSVGGGLGGSAGSTGGAGSSGTAGSTGGGGSAGGGTGGDPPACTGATIIAPDADGGLWPFAAYGPSGEMHVVYADATTGQPRHAVEENGAWTDEIIDDLVPGAAVYRISAAVDALRRVHVAYAVRRTVVATEEFRLYYTQRAAAGGWSPPVELSAAVIDKSASVFFAMGLDGDDEPYVAWIRARMIGVDRHSAAGWSEQTFANPNSASAIAAATDGSGRPWIFAAPVLFVPNATGYTMQNVPVSETRYLVVSAAGDTVYVSSGTGSITFGMGALWTTEAIPGVGSTPYLLTQTADGKPVAAFTTLDSGALIARVTRRDTGWVTVADYPLVVTAWNGSVQTGYSSTPIALDAQLHPAIVAPTDDNDDLRMYQLGPQGQVTHNINIKLRVPSPRGAVDGGQGRLVVAYYGDADTYVAQERAGGGFDAAKVGVQSLAASLTRDAQGKLWLAATQGIGDMGVVSASSPAGPWTYESLATFIATGKSTELVDAAVGPDGRPHVIYRVDGALWHGTRGESATQVTSALDSTQPVETLFDGAGAVHVVYGGNPALIVRWSGSVWQTAMTDVVRGARAFTDGAGHVCAVGIHSSTGAVSSVCLVGSNLVTTTLADPVSSVQSVALASDGTLRFLVPLIFLPPTPSQTAIINATTGVTERLMPMLNDPSMVVPASGAARIIYYDKATARLYVLGC